LVVVRFSHRNTVTTPTLETPLMDLVLGHNGRAIGNVVEWCPLPPISCCMLVNRSRNKSHPNKQEMNKPAELTQSAFVFNENNAIFSAQNQSVHQSNIYTHN
jgi:hypothetical protein